MLWKRNPYRINTGLHQPWYAFFTWQGKERAQAGSYFSTQVGTRFNQDYPATSFGRRKRRRNTAKRSTNH